MRITRVCVRVRDRIMSSSLRSLVTVRINVLSSGIAAKHSECGKGIHFTFFTNVNDINP